MKTPPPHAPDAAEPTARRPSLVLVASYISPVVGGVETYVSVLARNLAMNHGWRVVVVATADSGTDRRAAEGQFKDVDAVTVRWLRRFGRLSNTPIGWRWLRELRRIIAEEKPDVVNAHAPVPGLADLTARVCGDIPFVLTYHAGPMRKGHVAIDLLLRVYEGTVLRRTVRRSTRLICASPWVAEVLAPDEGPARAVITPAVDLDRFNTVPPPTDVGVLFVGTLDRAATYKGLPYLLEAIALLRDRGVNVPLRVVGDGTGRGDHEAYARDLRLEDRVTFLGSRAPADVRQAYAESSVVAVPSTFDNFPTVIVEAMASGRCVVASRVGSIPDLVDEGATGHLVEPGDPTALADALQRVLKRPQQAAAMGRVARESARDFGTAAQASRTDQVLRSALRRPTHVAVVSPYHPPVGGVERYAE